jgi:hypothetical protein
METRSLELAMEAGRREWERAWKTVRRGWYVGGQGFKERLLARAKDVLLGKRLESHSGRARAAHDKSQAQRMLEGGMRVLGLRRADLAKTPKGQLEKRVLAWWVYGHTTVTRRWIAGNLMMGYESGVSRAVSFVESSAAKEVIRMKSKLGNADVSSMLKL